MREFRYIEIRPQQRNWFAQLLGLVVGIAVLAVSIVLGAFLLAALLGCALLVAIGVSARLWWLRRQATRRRDGDYLETEYRVVDETRRPDNRRR